MKTPTLIESKGFIVNEPTFENSLLTPFILTGFTSRDFGMPYESIEEQIAGNLYLWLQQSYSVLWEVNAEQHQVLLYDNTIDKLGERFATLLRLSKESGESATWDMVKALALANYIIESVVFKIEGNWLLKYRNPWLNGLLKHFMFWLALQELDGNENAQKCLTVFMKKFSKDVDLKVIGQYPNETVMEAFMQCFFHGRNDMDIFLCALQNPAFSFHELR